jgi:dipeptidyl aminopeptidase/acylaminoacyl peptidase
VHKVDVATGSSVLVEAGVDNTFEFKTAKGVPVLRWDVLTPRTQAIYARPVGGTGWKLVRKVRINEADNGDFRPVGMVADDPDLWLALLDDPDKPGSTLVTLNLKTLELGAAPVVSHTEFGEPLFDPHQKFFAAELLGDRTDYEFADKSLAGHYRAMNKFFDNQCNVDIVAWSPDHNRLVASVSGPTEPGVFYLYDRAARRFDVVDEQRPWLRDRLAAVEMLDLKTRDGVAMRAYLTVPIASAGAGPRPLVVMPHGGPEDHDTFCFDLVAQTFAARGWLVLQPNFRGSSGYGSDFALAGRRHWGDRMQEDVEDAVASVLASGRADPKRVAIWGASYGGYAALMGAVRRPDLYKAAVSIAGISDLPDFLAFQKGRETAESLAYQYWRSQFGDPATDSDAMVAASPRRRAKEIRAPVLLMHGNKDEIVDFNQSRTMADALKSAGKSCDYVVLEGEGHHLDDWKDKTRTLVLTRSCDVLAKAFA